MISKKVFLNIIKVYWRAVAVVFLAFLLNILLIFLVFGAKSEFLKKNENLNVLSAKRTSFLQLKRQFEEITATKEKVEKSFINNESIVDFIILIENIAKNTGNEIVIKSVSEESTEGIKAFRIELTGNYSGFVNFIAQMENSEKLAAPSKVDIREYVDPEKKTKLLKAVLDIKVLSI